MGLQIKIKSYEETKKEFFISDCTGSYSGDNKTGFGGPNESSAKILSSTLEIQGPNDEDYAHVIDVTGALPNKDNLPVEIIPSQVGQEGFIESGQYKFKLTHIFSGKNDREVKKTGYGSNVFIKDIECCVDKLAFDPFKKFDDLKQKKILELKSLYQGVLCQIESGHYDTANTTIDYLKAQCKCNGC